MQNIPAKFQILAPAGSVEQLISAVNNGCDAVYLGLDSFNARMKAPNFTLENLGEWVDYCHLYGVKVYVAINTSLKNDEFASAAKLLYDVYRRNVDGVIVTDMALMRIASTLPKPFEVVASTQLNVHDKYGAEFVKQCGATTVVCARECSLQDISDIASTGIGVECFLHGAMCVCQSGQCLFSSMVGGNSGNRGLCAQPCRKFYYAEGKTDNCGYLLSARDMCSLETASAMATAGATTFKIEGRNRRPEYAGITSRIYRKLFDGNFESCERDYGFLAEMFNRGMSSNRYLRGDNSDIIYPAVQNHTGVVVGVIRDGKVIASQKICKGDGLKIFDRGKEVCGGVAIESGLDCVKAHFDGKVSDGMIVNRTTSVELCNDVLSLKRKISVTLKLTARAGQTVKIFARCLNSEVYVSGDFLVEKALNVPTSLNEIIEQLQKSGNTCYTITDVILEVDDIFIAKSQINALRRAVLDKLTKQLIADYNLQFENRKSAQLKGVGECRGVRTGKVEAGSTACAVVCFDEQQLLQAKDKVDYLIYKPDIIDLKALTTAIRYNAFVDLPSFSEMQYVGKLLASVKSKLVCNNVGHVQIARQYGIDYIAGAGLNIFNDSMAAEFSDAETFVYSRELTLREISAFRCNNGLIYVDGSIALMQLCHCPYKVVYGGDCDNCKAELGLTYRDEFNNRFKIRRRRVNKCTFELINGQKLSVVAKLKSSGRYIIDYDKAVLQHYLRLNVNEIDDYIEKRPYTKGRLYDKIN